MTKCKCKHGGRLASARANGIFIVGWLRWEGGCAVKASGGAGGTDRELVLVRVEEVVQVVHGDGQVVLVDQAGRGGAGLVCCALSVCRHTHTHTQTH